MYLSVGLCSVSPTGIQNKIMAFCPLLPPPPVALSTCGSLVGIQILCLHVYLAQSVFLRRGWPMSVCWNEQTQAGVYLDTIGQKVEIKAQSFLKEKVEHGMAFMSMWPKFARGLSLCSFSVQLC